MRTHFHTRCFSLTRPLVAVLLASFAGDGARAAQCLSLRAESSPTGGPRIFYSTCKPTAPHRFRWKPAEGAPSTFSLSPHRLGTAEASFSLRVGNDPEGVLAFELLDSHSEPLESIEMELGRREQATPDIPVPAAPPVETGYRYELTVAPALRWWTLRGTDNVNRTEGSLTAAASPDLEAALRVRWSPDLSSGARAAIGTVTFEGAPDRPVARPRQATPRFSLDTVWRATELLALGTYAEARTEFLYEATSATELRVVDAWAPGAGVSAELRVLEDGPSAVHLDAEAGLILPIHKGAFDTQLGRMWGAGPRYSYSWAGWRAAGSIEFQRRIFDSTSANFRANILSAQLSLTWHGL